MSRITRSYRIRSYPNGAQRRLRDRWFGAYRWLWNTTLEIRTAAYRECGLTLTGNDMSRWLTQWKGTQGHEWLKVVPATCLTQCLRDQDSAFRNYFAGRAQYPKFKRKGSAGSLRFQDAGVTSGTCAWMREMHAQKRFWCRCSQRKREAGNAIEPVWNRQDCISGAVKFLYHLVFSSLLSFSAPRSQ
jgi:hypothetical protein